MAGHDPAELLRSRATRPRLLREVGAWFLVLTLSPVVEAGAAPGLGEPTSAETASTSSKADDSRDLRPPAPGTWNRLVFEARKWGLLARSVVERSAVEDGTTLLEVTSSYLGRTSEQELVFGEEGRLDRSSTSRRSGRSSYWNERFREEGGFRRIRHAPETRSQFDLPAREWTNIRRFFEPDPSSRVPCPVIADPLEILHFLRIDGSGLEGLCFLSGKTLFHLSTESAARSNQPLALVDGRENAPKGSPQPVTLLLQPVSLEPSLEPTGSGDFELLGLEGDIEIELDRRDGLPLRVSGRLPLIGRLDITLREVR